MLCQRPTLIHHRFKLSPTFQLKVQYLLGFAHFYREFMKNFIVVPVPLHGLTTVKSRLWWPSIVNNVAEYVVAFPACSWSKCLNSLSAGLWQPLPVPHRSWSLDIIRISINIRGWKSSSGCCCYRFDLVIRTVDQSFCQAFGICLLSFCLPVYYPSA